MNVNFVTPPGHTGGGREVWELWGNGPASYNQTTGDPLLVAGGQFIGVPGSGFLSQSGRYIVYAFPSAVNALRALWSLRWCNYGAGSAPGVTSVTIATPGSAQTNGTYVINASTGTAQVQITIAGGVITQAKVINPGSYTGAAPTFTVAQGGTPGTLTANLGSTAGMEVGPGTNLSAESVQFSAIGGQL